MNTYLVDINTGIVLYASTTVIAPYPTGVVYLDSFMSGDPGDVVQYGRDYGLHVESSLPGDTSAVLRLQDLEEGAYVAIDLDNASTADPRTLRGVEEPDEYLSDEELAEEARGGAPIYVSADLASIRLPDTPTDL